MIRNVYLLTTIALSVSYSQNVEHNSPVSPCPDVFTYEPLGMNDQPLAKRWYGVIKLSTDVTLYALWLNINLNHKADILGNWVGEVSTKDNLNFKIENDNFKLIPGEPKIVRFFIQYSQDEKPDLQSILFNGREICNISQDENHYTVSNVYGFDRNSGVQEQTGVTITTDRTRDITTRENKFNREETKDQNRLTTSSISNYYTQATRENKFNRGETKDQNRLTTSSISNYYTQATTEKLRVEFESIQHGNKVQNMPKKNLTQDRQQTISSFDKKENKIQSIQSVPKIKVTVYQQALNEKIPSSTTSYSQVSFGSTKKNNSLPRTTNNQKQAIDSDKTKYQQLKPDYYTKIDTLQSTTRKIWIGDTYSSTTEGKFATSPNTQIGPDNRPQNGFGISESYGQSDVSSKVQTTLHDTSQNNQNSYVPSKQFGLSDMIHKVMNNPPSNTGESVSVLPISIGEKFNIDRQPIEVISTSTDASRWSQMPSELSYGSTGPKYADSKEERPVSDQSSSHGQQLSPDPRPATVIEHEEVDPYSYSSLPIYIPNFKPEETCGKVVIKPPMFLPHSSTTSEGQWPWQAALYQQQSVHLKYICGGTLVSRSHVITAAHCVTRKKTMRPVNKYTLTVYLGKFNLRTSIEGVQVLFVNDIIVYPSFNSTTYSRDLAILELREPATYSQWVRPVCLWPEDHISLDSIAGRVGSVVGWGVETTGVPKAELYLLEMPIVNQDTCFNSYNFYERFASAHTFCARYKDDNDVCNSDSGGGMVLKRDNAWYLRGVVSIAVTSHTEGRCDSKHFIIFTDIAKFLPWILEHVDL